MLKKSEKYKDVYHYPETGVDIKIFQDNIVEIYYPRANYSEEENIAETKWVRSVLDKIVAKYPNQDLYVLVDLTKPGNAELIADESMDMYVKMLKHKQLKKVAAFGQTRWFAFLLNVMIKLSKTFNKFKYFDNKEEAIAWLRKSMKK